MNEQTKNFATYFHAVNSGDLIAALPGMREIYRKTGWKAIIYQRLNTPGRYYQGATHPLKDEHGNLVTMNKRMFNLIKPLIVAQDYVQDMLEWKGFPERCEYDLNRIHDGVDIHMPNGSIHRWHWYVYPDMACDLSERWIDVPAHKEFELICKDDEDAPFKQMVTTLSDRVLINFTERYRNPSVTYYFLRLFQDRCVFAGTEDEHKAFCTQWKLNLPYLRVYNFVELAQAIADCKFFLGNQSMCWNIAEGLKVPRMLETCHWALNCIPVGEHAYDYYFQGAAEYYFNFLIGRDMAAMRCPVCDHDNYKSFSKQDVDYFRCVKCNTIYSKPLAQENKVGGDSYENRKEQNQDRIERFKSMGVTSLIDFGCGHGELLEDMANTGIQAFGYDKYNEDYAIMPKVKVDCVSMIEVMEHLTSPFEELNVIVGALKPNGLLYIETSFADFLDMSSDYIDPVKGHCTIFSYASMDFLMKQKGFVLDKIINRNTRVYKLMEVKDEK